MLKQEWQRPRVLSVNFLPDVLGDCVGGSTDTHVNGVVGSCINGQVTGKADHVCNCGDIGASNCVGGSIGALCGG